MYVVSDTLYSSWILSVDLAASGCGGFYIVIITHLFFKL